MRCCLQDVFNIARSILVQLPLSFFSIRLVSVHVVHPYCSIDTTDAWKKYVLFIGHRMYMHDIKLFVKNEKRIGDSDKQEYIARI